MKGLNGGVFASVYKMIDFIDDVVKVRQTKRKIYHVYYRPVYVV